MSSSSTHSCALPFSTPQVPVTASRRAHQCADASMFVSSSLASHRTLPLYGSFARKRA